MKTLLSVSILALVASSSSGKVFRASLLSMKENQIPQAEILLEQSSGTSDQSAAEGTTDTPSNPTPAQPAGFIPGSLPTPVLSTNKGDKVLLQSGQSDDPDQEPTKEGTQEAGQESAEEAGQESTEEAGQESTEEAGQESTEEEGQESSEDAAPDIPISAESFLEDIEAVVSQIQKNVQALEQLLGMSTGTEQASESG